MRVETERLILREMRQEDFEALKAVLSDPENMRYYPAPYDDRGVRRWIDWCVASYAQYGFGLWAVILKDTEEMIGDCGISMQRINGRSLPEIGYHILLRYHRQGYGTEAARACIKAGFEQFGFPALYSYMVRENVPSYRTAMKNGMRQIEEYIAPDGEPHRVFRITKEEWMRNEETRKE